MTQQPRRDYYFYREARIGAKRRLLPWKTPLLGGTEPSAYATQRKGQDCRVKQHIAINYDESSRFLSAIKFDIDSRDEIEETISLWQETWKKSGWHPEIVSLDIAKQSPHYSSLTDRSTILYRSTNPVEYTEICYARWLAYQQCRISFWADYDVMNFGFTPEHLDSILSIDNNLDDPIYLSAAGAVGFASSKGFDKIIKTYLDFIDNPPLVLDYPLSQDINDMNIMRALRLNWYDRIAYNDPRFCHDYVNDGWANKHLVHFPYFGTPKPRNSTIRSVIASKQRN